MSKIFYLTGKKAYKKFISKYSDTIIVLNDECVTGFHNVPTNNIIIKLSTIWESKKNIDIFIVYFDRIISHELLHREINKELKRKIYASMYEEVMIESMVRNTNIKNIAFDMLEHFRTRIRKQRYNLALKDNAIKVIILLFMIMFVWNIVSIIINNIK